jgi:hypothetical protein
VGKIGSSTTKTRTEVPGRHVTSQQVRIFMEFRHHHPQRIAAAKSGFSERTARRIETNRRSPPQAADPRPRATPDPFGGLWDAEIRPMLEAQPGLRPITLLQEMQRRRPDHDWDRLRRSLERRVRTWRAEQGADREVIFRQDHVPGQQGLSDFTDMGDLGVSITDQPLDYPGLLGLGACRTGTRRRKLHRTRRRLAECTLVSRRRASRAPL